MFDNVALGPKLRFSEEKQMPKHFPTVLVKSDVLRSWLLVTGWTQSQLANALDVSKGRVSQLIGASGIDPSAHLIAKLMKVTGMPFERLFRIGSERPSRRRFRNGSPVMIRAIQAERPRPPSALRRSKHASLAPADVPGTDEVA